MQQKPSTGFEGAVLPVLTRLRAALADLLKEIASEPPRVRGRGRPSNRATRGLQLDRSLAWRIDRFVRGTSPLLEVEHLPSPEGFRLLLDAARKQGASAERLDAVQEAIGALQELQAEHADSRESLAVMTEALAGKPSRSHLNNRRLASKHMAAVWGVQARVQLHCDVVYPSRPGPDVAEGTLDMLAISGFAGLVRLRSGMPWQFGRFLAQTQGQLLARPRGPIEPESLERHGAPLLAKFCSDPLPTLRFDSQPSGGTDAYVLESGLGTQAAQTIFLGEYIERLGTKYAEPGMPFGRTAQACFTPVETFVFDHLVHGGVFDRVAPEVNVYCELGRRVMMPQSKAEPAQVRVPERFEYLGRGAGALRCDVLPEYPAMVAHACAARGVDVDALDVYRLQMQWPPIPSTITMRYPLPQPPSR